MTQWTENETVKAPDILGTVRQYKVFKVQATSPVNSLGHAFRWTIRDWNYASCQLGSPCRGDVPVENCSCGFYTFHLPDTYDATGHSYCQVSGDLAIGVVEASGGMVFHPLGLRAAQLRLVALAGYTDLAQSVLSMYVNDESGLFYDSAVRLLPLPELAAAYPPEDVSNWLGCGAYTARWRWLAAQPGGGVCSPPPAALWAAPSIMAPAQTPSVSRQSRIDHFRRVYGIKGTITGRLLGRKSQ